MRIGAERDGDGDGARTDCERHRQRIGRHAAAGFQFPPRRPSHVRVHPAHRACSAASSPKYAGVLLLPVVLLYLLSSREQRHWLLKPQPYLAVLLAGLIFMPAIYWNSQHGWVSFAFQSSRRLGELGGLKPRYFLGLVASQFLLLTPYLFVMAMAVLGRGARAAFAGKLDDRGLPNGPDDQESDDAQQADEDVGNERINC